MMRARTWFFVRGSTRAPRAAAGLLLALALVGCRSHYRKVRSFELDPGGGCAVLEIDGEFCWGTRSAERSAKPTRSKAEPSAPQTVARFDVQTDTTGAQLCDRSKTPAVCATPDDPSTVAIGVHHACFVAKDGAVWCLGDADHGRLGADGDGPQPVQVRGVAGARKVVVADDAACVLLGDGTVSCWGDNSKHTLAQAKPGVLEPSPLVGLFAIVDLAAAGDQVCASLTDGGLRCWGTVRGEGASNGRGGTVNNVPMPVMFP